MNFHHLKWSCLALLTFAAMLGLSGCGEPEPEESVKPAAPPPPSPEQIAMKIVADLQLNAPLPAPDSKMPQEASTTFLSTVRNANMANQSSDEGKRAMQIVAQKLSSRLRELETNKLWEHALTYSKAYTILNPGSTKFAHIEDMAKSEMTKPTVSVKGFYIDGKTNQTAAFIDFYMPLEKVTYSQKVRVGEEFYGLKLAAIIGNNQGVTMEYMATDQTFDILMASARQ